MDFLGNGTMFGPSSFSAFGQEPGAEGHTGTAAVAPRPGEIAAEDALKEISTAYNALVSIAMKLERIYGLVGLGNRIPCQYVNTYNDAVRDYLGAAQSVFAQIRAKNPKYDIMQTTFDAEGREVVRHVGITPLMPPVIQQADCKAAPMLTDLPLAGSGEFGAIQIGIVIVIAIVSGATIIGVTHLIVDRPESAISATRRRLDWLQGKMNCTDQRINQYLKLGWKRADIPVGEIDAFCEKGVGAAPQPPEPDRPNKDWMIWMGVGAAAVIGGLFLLRYLSRGRDEFGVAFDITERYGPPGPYEVVPPDVELERYIQRHGRLPPWAERAAGENGHKRKLKYKQPPQLKGCPC